MSDQTQQPMIQSVVRAISILKCVGEHRELGLTEISKMLGLHKSTAAGLINTLKAERFLEISGRTGKLRLGLGIFALAMNNSMELGEICDPYLDLLLEETGETVNLIVRDGDQVVYVTKKDSAHSIRSSTRVGSRRPLHCTAAGKAMLAFMERDEAKALIDSFDMTAFTDRTITEKPRLHSELDTIARDGVAFDLEEMEAGLVCVAAPVYYRPGNPVGAISISGPAMRMNGEALSRAADLLRKTSKQVCGELTRLSARQEI